MGGRGPGNPRRPDASRNSGKLPLSFNSGMQLAPGANPQPACAAAFASDDALDAPWALIIRAPAQLQLSSYFAA